MSQVLITVTGILVIAIIMSMTGRGGGNFYLPVLIAAGVTMHEAATTGQLILVATAVTALVVFQKHRTVDWKLALVIDPPTDVMAFVGGYYAHLFSGTALKFVFAGLLVISSLLMLRPVRKRSQRNEERFWLWRRQYGGREYVVNLLVVLPITAATGFVAGMVGVSGGSFKIPLMVLACGVPMRIAVGTSCAMVAATALMGFSGHTISGDFNPTWAIPLSVVAVLGGLLGGRLSLRIRQETLKQVFAYTTLGAAVFMVLNALLCSGGS